MLSGAGGDLGRYTVTNKTNYFFTFSVILLQENIKYIGCTDLLTTAETTQSAILFRVSYTTIIH
jgi:hypothetical protein